jgi:hypothetical protein
MSLTLVPPKAGRTPNYHIRGSYLGIAVNRSAKTPVKDIARRIKKRIEGEIEQGLYSPSIVVSLGLVARRTPTRFS